jgi:putative protease
MNVCKKTELLLPAGNLENLKTAFLYGADAVYCGLPDLSLRAKAGFSTDELREGIEIAKNMKKKLYIALNLFARNEQIKAVLESVNLIKSLAPDGLIIADAGVFAVIKRLLPDIHITLSTQANISNIEAVTFWKNAGANRIVLARECSFSDIEEIRGADKNTELECFVHGAMCMSISGRCLISNFLSARGANQGECSQSCRWKYKISYTLEEETRGGEKFEIYEEDGYSHILSSKDLCLMPVLDKYLNVGVNSFKVEGRHKNAFYIASVARAYRLAIDDWYALKSKAREKNWKPQNYIDMLSSVKNRGYTLGFHSGGANELSTDYESTKSTGKYQFAGIVRNWDEKSFIFEVRNTINTGDVLEFLLPQNCENLKITLDKIIDAKSGKEIERASAGQGFCIRIYIENTEETRQKIPEYSVAKIKCEEETNEKTLERNTQFWREICTA